MTTTTPKQFTAADARKANAILVDALKRIEGEIGFSTSGRLIYDAHGVTLKVFAGFRQAGGVPATPESAYFTAAAGFVGVDAGALGRTFKHRERTLRLTGYATRHQQFPFRATDTQTGLVYKMSARYIASLFPANASTIASVPAGARDGGAGPADAAVPS